MRSWIFQATPDTFDIDGYLRFAKEILWTVRQQHFKVEMIVGDFVYIWRSAGSARGESGIIATGVITEPPSMRNELSDALPFWKEVQPDAPALRVALRILGVASTDRMIKRQILKEDPILRDLRILHFAAETNYATDSAQARRLESLWRGGGSEAGPVTGTAEVSTGHNPSYSDFGEAPNDNPADIQLFARKVRKGQPHFRRNLITAYDARCAISGWGPEAVLEAAHIRSHSETGVNSLDNGLLLRSDLHGLLDDGLLRIDPDKLEVLVDDSLRATEYWQYNGKQLRARRDGSHPTESLRKRWSEIRT